MITIVWVVALANAACPAQVVRVTPAPGAADVFPTQEIVVELDTTVAEVGFLLTETGIAAIPGTTFTADGVTWRFYPPAPLAPAIDHTVRADVCGVDTVWSFATSAVGPRTGVAALDGRAWELQLDAGVWEEPAALSGLLGGYLQSATLVLTAAADADERLALSWDREPADPCAATQPLDTNYGADPFVRAKTRTLELVLDSLTLALSDVLFTGGFTPDGTDLQGVQLEGVLDTRALITDGSPPDSLCIILATFGDACFACLDGEPLCVRLDLRDIPATADLACPAEPSDTGDTAAATSDTTDTAVPSTDGPSLHEPTDKGGCACSHAADAGSAWLPLWPKRRRR